MEIENMDKYIDDKDKIPLKQNHFLAPKNPFRALAIGPSGGGKSNVILNLIMKYLAFDTISVIARELEEDKYKLLKAYIEELEYQKNKKLKKKKKKNGEESEPVKVLLKWSNSLDDLPNLEELDTTKTNLILIDDMATEKDRNKLKKLEDFFIMSRKRNCSILYLSQSYFAIPKIVRLNSNFFMIFSFASNKEKSLLRSEHATDIEKETFDKLYREAIKDPYCFLTIDRQTTKKPLIYRKCFDNLFFQ